MDFPLLPPNILHGQICLTTGFLQLSPKLTVIKEIIRRSGCLSFLRFETLAAHGLAGVRLASVIKISGGNDISELEKRLCLVSQTQYSL